MSVKKQFKGLHHAKDALKVLKPDEQKKLLALLLQKEPELAKRLQESLFEFNDIALLSKADFKFLWFELPRNLWIFSLRACTPDISAFIKSCLSVRAYIELIDEIKTLGPQPASKVNEAQKKLLEEIRLLAKQKRVILPQGKN